MWYLLYVSMVMSVWADAGMMATGPFETEKSCYTSADRSWKKTDGWIKKDKLRREMNFYDSKYKIKYVKNKNVRIGTYYSCVQIRKVEEE